MPAEQAITSEILQTDVVIIGAGPVGLFSIFECGMVGLKCHVIDSFEEIGGQCTALYPEKPIYDIPAFPVIEAADLIKQLEEQAAPFHPAYHLNQQVVSICDNDDFLHIKTSKNIEIKAKALIIAAGAGAFGPNKPPLDNLEAYEGKSIFYMVRNKQDFAGKDIVIAGGGDSAVDWALSLSSIAKSVSLVHRRDKFRASPESINQLKTLAARKEIDLIVPYQLEFLDGDNGQLKAVGVKHHDGSVRTLKADILLPFYGLAMDLGPIAKWGLNLNHNHIVVDPTTCKTSQNKIYAIGDIASYKNKIKLILTGFSEAAFAAHDIYKLINPDHPLHFEYSTTKGAP